ncbi:MAG TPA: T9SS type A sorting domain-containing protein, partial [Bacillota bacterium]|nr:T9SS type A sorting domain-containing protein [Bacillota bacterium]
PNITQQPVSHAVNSGNNTVFTITADAGATYQWQADAGSGFSDLSNTAPYSGVQTSTLTITNTTPGLTGTKYRCVVTNNDCESVSTDAVLTINVGISEILSGGKLTVYPNPATTMLTVDIQLANPQSVTFSVMDITGRVFMLSQTLATSNNHTRQLDITHLEAGVYLLRLTAGDETAVVRFVVE